MAQSGTVSSGNTLDVVVGVNELLRVYPDNGASGAIYEVDATGFYGQVGEINRTYNRSTAFGGPAKLRIASWSGEISYSVAPADIYADDKVVSRWSFISPTQIDSVAALKTPLGSLASISRRPVRVALIGHSQAAYNDIGEAAGHSYSPMGPIRWAEALSAGKIICDSWSNPTDPGEPIGGFAGRYWSGANHAVASTHTTHLYTRLLADRSATSAVLAPYITWLRSNSDVIYMVVGSSELGPSNVASVLAKTKNILEVLAQAGKPILYEIPTPRDLWDVGHEADSALRVALHAYREGMLEIIAGLPHVVAVRADIAVCGGPVGINTPPLFGALRDGTHKGALAGYLCGLEVLNAILAYAPNAAPAYGRNTIPFATATDMQGNLVAPGNDNLGADVAAGAGCTGTGGYTTARTAGTATAVLSKVARDGGGSWQRMVITPTVGVSTFQWEHLTKTPALPPVGSWVRGWVPIRIKAHPGWRGFQHRATYRDVADAASVTNTRGFYDVSYSGHPSLSGFTRWPVADLDLVIPLPKTQITSGMGSIRSWGTVNVNGDAGLDPMQIDIGGVVLQVVPPPLGYPMA